MPTTVFLEEEIQLDIAFFAGRHSNGNVVLANFPHDLQDSDERLSELHLNSEQQMKLLHLLQRSLSYPSSSC